MSIHNICFQGDIRKISILLDLRKQALGAQEMQWAQALGKGP